MPRSARTTLGVVTLLLVALAAGVAAATQFASPPRLRDGEVPAPPIQAYGGGQVVIEAEIDPRGQVAAAYPILATPPFTAAVVGAVSGWTFAPGTIVRDGRRVSAAGKVLVVALFRPPSLFGPAPGALPTSHRRASPELPVPGGLEMPAYPPRALGDGTVLLEIELSTGGAIRAVRVLTQDSPFDRAALNAASAWRFFPPPAGATAPSFVYAILGFRAPVS